MEERRISIDPSQPVFTLHGSDREGRALLRRNLRRHEVVPFFEKLEPLAVALEACGGSPHWGRTLQALGHRVRLIALVDAGPHCHQTGRQQRIENDGRSYRGSVFRFEPWDDSDDKEYRKYDRKYYETLLQLAPAEPKSIG